MLLSRESSFFLRFCFLRTFLSFDINYFHVYCRSPDSEDYSPLDIEQITVAANDSTTIASSTPVALIQSSNEKVGNESFFLLA
jgi:hypothetical protein